MNFREKNYYDFTMSANGQYQKDSAHMIHGVYVIRMIYDVHLTLISKSIYSVEDFEIYVISNNITYYSLVSG